MLLLLVVVIFFNNLDFFLYSYFQNMGSVSDKNHLIIFFKNITTLGDSFWYFCFFVFGILFVLVFERFRWWYFFNLNDLKNLFFYCLFLFAFNGILVQALKHIIGRARPNYTNINVGSDFNLFTTNSNFHSLPSGHSSTIFILAFIFILLIPRLKYSFIIFAAIVSFSRVVVGAHFLTDILAGLIIALVSYKFINFVYEKKFINNKPVVISYINNNFFYLVSFSLCLFAVLLTIGPTLDMYIGNVFYLGNDRFVLESYYLITIVFREIFLPLILFYFLILPFFSNFRFVKKIFFNYCFSYKEIFYIWLATSINILLVINFFLKTFWGRSRPSDIMYEGAEGFFTPWYTFSNYCLSNCSFVSGDSAVGFSIIVLFFITNNIKYIYCSLFCGFLLGAVRILEGGHFASDVIFSGIIVYLLCFLLKKFFNFKLK